MTDSERARPHRASADPEVFGAYSQYDSHHSHEMDPYRVSERQLEMLYRPEEDPCTNFVVKDRTQQRGRGSRPTRLEYSEIQPDIRETADSETRERSAGYSHMLCSTSNMAVGTPVYSPQMIHQAGFKGNESLDPNTRVPAKNELRALRRLLEPSDACVVKIACCKKWADRQIYDRDDSKADGLHQSPFLLVVPTSGEIFNSDPLLTTHDRGCSVEGLISSLRATVIGWDPEDARLERCNIQTSRGRITKRLGKIRCLLICFLTRKRFTVTFTVVDEGELQDKYLLGRPILDHYGL